MVKPTQGRACTECIKSGVLSFFVQFLSFELNRGVSRSLCGFNRIERRVLQFICTVEA